VGGGLCFFQGEHHRGQPELKINKIQPVAWLDQLVLVAGRERRQAILVLPIRFAGNAGFRTAQKAGRPGRAFQPRAGALEQGVGPSTSTAGLRISPFSGETAAPPITDCFA